MATRWLHGLIFASALALAPHAAHGGDRGDEAARVETGPQKELPEYKAKALYLLHFARYVRWPAEAFEGPDAPVTITVLGKDPFGKLLEETLDKQRVRNRCFEVRRVRKPEDLRPCHILFVPADASPLLQPALEALAGHNVLVIGESSGLARKGAILNLYIENARVCFEVNNQAARRAGLEISSELLKLARKVEEK